MTSPLLGKFCGNQIPRTIPSFGNQLYLQFSSDNSLSARGFEVFWDGTSTGFVAEPMTPDVFST
jgi:cubilin